MRYNYGQLGSNPEKMERIEKIGSRLSIELDCPVHWPAFDKGMFACKCGICFPLFALEGDKDWNWAKEKHESESRT